VSNSPGMLAGVEYHNLGVSVKMQVCPETLRCLLDKVPRSPKIRDGLAGTQRMFQAGESKAPAASMVETCIGRPVHVSWRAEELS
jgi:hypothetical protein